MRLKDYAEAAIAAPIASFVARFIFQEIESAIHGKMALHDAERNHAIFEGTWTPYDQRVEKVSKEIQSYKDQVNNHRFAEGMPEAIAL